MDSHNYFVSSGMGSVRPRGMLMVQPLGVLFSIKVALRLYVVTTDLNLSICVVHRVTAKDLRRAFASSL